MSSLLLPYCVTRSNLHSPEMSGLRIRIAIPQFCVLIIISPSLSHLSLFVQLFSQVSNVFRPDFGLMRYFHELFNLEHQHSHHDNRPIIDPFLLLPTQYSPSTSKS